MDELLEKYDSAKLYKIDNIEMNLTEAMYIYYNIGNATLDISSQCRYTNNGYGVNHVIKRRIMYWGRPRPYSVVDINEFKNYLLLHPDKINETNNCGWNLLMLDACCEPIDITKFLLENCADVNSQNNLGETALMIACKYKDVTLDKLPLYFTSNTNVNLIDVNGNSALMNYCDSGVYESYEVASISLFLENGAHILFENSKEKNVYDIIKYRSGPYKHNLLKFFDDCNNHKFMKTKSARKI